MGRQRFAHGAWPALEKILRFWIINMTQHAHHPHHPPHHHPRPPDLKSILRVHAKIDLVVKEDPEAGPVDIRGSRILAVNANDLVIWQPKPPLTEGEIGETLKASVIHRSVTTKEQVRWVWTARITGLEAKFKVQLSDGSLRQAPAVILSLPHNAVLTKGNLRKAYRIDTSRENVNVALRPELGRVRLVNFSVEGLMLSTPHPTRYAVGQKIHFDLVFPLHKVMPVCRVEGFAEIVRQDVRKEAGLVNLGLKFFDLKDEAKWTLPKILQYYILEEQKKRRKEE
jgi:hypothetical protein